MQPIILYQTRKDLEPVFVPEAKVTVDTTLAPRISVLGLLYLRSLSESLLGKAGHTTRF
jgi:hypothetical protein